ncbi:metal ion transporters (Cu(2+), Fe(2+), etc.) [Rhodopirellula islandica]|uniref:Metal ion transporters (Cu(2+), Fe(2+), etc.) n=1 Tax=Rhodopirellula islandica TaxID=595434 RepID=A0A0J1B455_RHOIS|nr:Nramp family divalent metal transporter [Rhodopirellula islandica]KLU01276.1 metal ion transporters (Cu(2+), Fe(2+), etc.) [Rhodopirellula islandica]
MAWWCYYIKLSPLHPTSVVEREHVLKSPESERRDPPTHWWRILTNIGPGLIIAGSIVGSGELIATTKTGAEAGFTLLWLILLGCVVKVFTQVEMGRYTLTSGKTSLQAFNELPGPRLGRHGNWLVWAWAVMWLASIGQQGGIVGSVGQAVALTMPATAHGVSENQVADAEQLLTFERYAVRSESERSTEEAPTRLQELDHREAEVVALRLAHELEHGKNEPPDIKLWATVITIATSILLFVGRYGLIQTFSTVLVGSFTLLTLINLFLLQGEVDYRVTASEFFSGLKGALPASENGGTALATALATFGIIGVGAGELIAYPYWCLEKGYAKFTGKNDGTPQWRERAAGWMRVMQVDAWGSMLVYTFATVAFYLLGAAVLHRVGLNPEKSDLVRTLAVMYVPVFSNWAAALFLFGAIAVLYSTFFVACAGHARVFSDALRVVGWIDDSQATRDKWVRGLGAFFPIMSLGFYIAFPSPAKLVLISGVTQGVVLPLIAGAAIWFRYKRSVDGLRPGKLWDGMLWLSGIAMLITGVWTIFATVT